MTTPPGPTPAHGEADHGPAGLYRRVLDTLDHDAVPVLVGGTYALTQHTGLERPTKDLDLFLRREDLARARLALQKAGFETALPYPHWLGKARAEGVEIDLIFNSGNGLTPVDAGWFQHAPTASVLGRRLPLVPAEELLWSKMFVMERERFDGADVIHLLLHRAAGLDWERLLMRVGPHWRVLLAHLVLFGFVFPAQRQRVPQAVMTALLQRLQREGDEAPDEGRLCRGTLLSREQYLPDVQAGWHDARGSSLSTMTPRDIDVWTQAIPERPGHPSDAAGAPP